MAIATTNSFNLNIGEIVEEAYERAGLEARTGYDYRTARRSIDMMMIEWQNRGIMDSKTYNNTTVHTLARA